jgi:hypothetical protein
MFYYIVIIAYSKIAFGFINPIKNIIINIKNVIIKFCGYIQF